MCFSWKAKAVISLCVFSVFLQENTSWAQPVQSLPAARKITVSFHNIPCEDALQQLAKRSDISFVYSSSVLDLKKIVSFSFYDQSLDEILKEVGRQMNLSFKLEGNHIVIKKSTEVSHPVKAKIVTKIIDEFQPILKGDPTDPILASLSSQTFTSPSYKSVYDLNPGLSQEDSAISEKTAKLIAKIQRQLLHSTDNVSRKDNANANWFTSGSLIFNDYSQGGIEIQGGHRLFYAVLNAARLDNNRYRIGYGAGTSILLSPKWSLQSNLTTARITSEKDFAILRNSVKLTSWHTQLKVQAGYALTQRISLRGGITFNLLNTRYKFLGFNVPADIPLYFKSNDPVHRESHLLPLSNVLTSSSTIHTPYTISNSYSDNNYLNTKTWIGFEVGISYQINFFSHR